MLYIRYRRIKVFGAVITLATFVAALLCGNRSSENLTKWQGSGSSKHAKVELQGRMSNRTYYHGSENGSMSSRQEVRPLRCDHFTTNLAYIKTHKTGSNTMAHIIDRFGFKRNLSFILPQDVRAGRNYYLNITREYCRKTLLPPLYAYVPEWNGSYEYNLSALHTLYDRTIIDQLIGPQAKYVTTLRDPATQFQSAFRFYHFANFFPIQIKQKVWSKSTEDKIKEWFRNPEHYLMKIKNISENSSSKFRTEPFVEYARNSQMNDLGFETKHHGDLNKVSDYITYLDRNFDLVLITEYFDESLLILKKEFCWELEDILYESENQQSKRGRSLISQNLTDTIRKWSTADFQLYQHFNRTLWQKIQEYGPQFSEDLKNFRELRKQVLNSCSNRRHIAKDKFFNKAIYTLEISDWYDFCNLLLMTKDQLVDKIRKRQSAGHNI